MDDRLVALVSGGRKATLVARVDVDLQVELEHRAKAPPLRLVGPLGVKVQQEPPQTVAAPALGGDVVIHPRTRVAGSRERTGALPLVVVVEANGVGAPTPLADALPRRALRPRSSHPGPQTDCKRARRSTRAWARSRRPLSLATPWTPDQDPLKAAEQSRWDTAANEMRSCRSMQFCRKKAPKGPLHGKQEVPGSRPVVGLARIRSGEGRFQLSWGAAGVLPWSA
jgi:hypothetical protein